MVVLLSRVALAVALPETLQGPGAQEPLGKDLLGVLLAPMGMVDTTRAPVVVLVAQRATQLKALGLQRVSSLVLPSCIPRAGHQPALQNLLPMTVTGITEALLATATLAWFQ
jgi:hypothetical protein